MWTGSDWRVQPPAKITALILTLYCYHSIGELFIGRSDFSSIVVWCILVSKSSVPSGEIYQTSLPWGSQIAVPISSTSLIVSNNDTEEGAKADLDEVIALWRGVLEVTPPENPERRSTLINFAHCLRERFNIDSAMADLDEVITPGKLY
ncbi:hypothetical protein EV401DRAFT_2077727 [Pisolithus croceorrhizus]|nr:hypothetical protein EV401DRAFT_2077727 [Pisolithus croceorrhizus]